MNHKVFIEKSDEIINSMNLDELRKCLYNVAKKTHESKREVFLQLLNDCYNKIEGKENKENSQYKKLLSDEKVNNKLVEISDIL